MTFTQSSASEFVSMYVTGRKATDPSGTMQAPVLVKAGETTFSGGRIGDYSGISVDPVAGSSFWVGKDYATEQHSKRNWATWVAHFSVSGTAALQAALTIRGLQAGSLSPLQLQPLLDEAIARWARTDVHVSTLQNINIRTADLGGTTLGLASGHTIWLDDNAAGWGWFVDPRPHSDSEFIRSGNQGEQQSMELLTALEHEIGHLLGHDHEADGLMG
jgi:hypothetical protein